MRRFYSVDAETGEVMPHVVVAFSHKVPSGFSEGWVAMAQTALEMIAACDKLQGNDLRVFLAIVGRLDFQNLILIEQAEIAKKLGMHRPDVSKSIKRLVELDIIIEGPKLGRSKRYQLNPNYGWKGSTKKHHEALRTADKAKAKGFKVVKGGQMNDPELRAKMEAEGQERLFD